MLLAAYATGIAMVCVIAPWDIIEYGMATGFLLLLWAGLHRSTRAWLPFLGLLVVAGFLCASLELEPPSTANHISRFAETSPLILEGTILTTEKKKEIYFSGERRNSKQGCQFTVNS